MWGTTLLKNASSIFYIKLVEASKRMFGTLSFPPRIDKNFESVSGVFLF